MCICGLQFPTVFVSLKPTIKNGIKICPEGYRVLFLTVPNKGTRDTVATQTSATFAKASWHVFAVIGKDKHFTGIIKVRRST